MLTGGTILTRCTDKFLMCYMMSGGRIVESGDLMSELNVMTGTASHSKVLLQTLLVHKPTKDKLRPPF